MTSPSERTPAIAAAKIAARFDVVCGGIDLDATLEALEARVAAARASEEPGELETADGIEGALAEAGLRPRDESPEGLEGLED